MASDNPYAKDISSSGWRGGVTSGVSMALQGATIGAAFGWVGALVGGLIGLVGGGLLGLFDRNEKIEEYKGLRDTAIVNMNEATELRNNLITDAQRSITGFRTKFDNAYGEGMYDTYDALFKRIFNLPSGSETVSGLLESLSLDSVSGDISSIAGGKLSKSALTGSISANDINSAYLEYMQERIRDSETAIGLQFRSQSYRENALIRNYYSSMDDYNLQIAQQFSDAFLSQRSTNAGLAGALGEAESAQASSGLRQTESSHALTAQQQFQQDLSDAAYYSTLDYMTGQYMSGVSSVNTGLIDSIYQIRNENAQLTEQFTSDFFDSMNDYYGSLIKDYYRPISDYEGEIDEYREQIDEYTEAIGDEEDMEEFLA